MLQIDTMVLMGMVKHSQVPKSKYVMSLQYLKNKVRDEVDFLHAINIKFPVIWSQHFRYQSLLQVGTIIIDGQDQAFSKYSKKQVCNILKRS